MISHRYTYLLLATAFAVVWLFFFARRRDLRRQMLVVSALFLPTCPLADLTYLQDWWRPITVTGTAIGIEHLLAGFSIPGVLTAAYKVVFGRRLLLPSPSGPARALAARLALALGVPLALFLGAFYALGLNSFLASILAAGSGLAIMWAMRIDLAVASVISGLLVIALATGVYSLLEVLTPGWVERFFFFENVPPIVLVNMPLDDAVYWLLAGMYGGIFYEFVLGATLVDDARAPMPTSDPWDEVSFACARQVTERYAAWVPFAVRTLPPELARATYAIYGCLRSADEIVDSFRAHDRAGLLEAFRADTFRAVREGVSANPVLHAFQIVVNRYGIEDELIEEFFLGMRRDLRQQSFDETEYREYIHGAAEVAGLMWLRAACHGEHDRYEALESGAAALASAIQKINFLRDIASDYHQRGRVYFPGLDFHRFSSAEKRAIETDIARDLEAAGEAVLGLPLETRTAVSLAYHYYSALLAKVRRVSPEELKRRTVRLSTPRKLLLLSTAYLRVRLGRGMVDTIPRPS